jgi:SAM-dependent methyltransferase
MVSTASLRPLSWLAKPIKAMVRPFPKVNAAMWNVQYRLGMWRYLDSSPDGVQALMLIEEYAPNASILDLGCGTSANLPLDRGTYRRYHGVDISTAAVDRGRALGRPNTSFETAEILSYDTGERYDAILLREVLYYFAVDRVAPLMRRLSEFLEPGGKIFVSLWAEYADSEVADVVRNCGLSVIDERKWKDGAGGTFIVLTTAGVQPR